MFICIEKNPNGSHACQYGGTLQEGWAYWDTKAVPVPESFPHVDIEVEDVHHDAVTTTRALVDENGEKVEKSVTLIPEFTRKEVVSATEREIPEEPEPEPSQMDIMEAQLTYTAMMTDTLLEV